MMTRIFVLLLTAASALSSSAAAAPDWKLVWSDEFSGPTIDRKNWTYDTGGGGWGNQELEFYTDRPGNSHIKVDASGNGVLVIEARKENLQNRNYTSARLKTQGLQSWTYGRIEARINLPSGKGVWPAFWMLGSNFPQVGWPACGEIDILEHVLPIGANTVRGSAHAPGYSGADSIHGDVTVSNLAGQFHVFGVEWEPTEIRWYVDGKKYFSTSPKTVHGKWIFDRPFFVILNLAIGGNWPGAPDNSTHFPVQMLVDYVRVYQKESTGTAADAAPRAGTLR